MRIRLISCEVFVREVCHAVSRSPHTIDVSFLPKSLHTRGGAAMRGVIQEAVDAVEPGVYDAVCLGYGLCNNGLIGLRAGAESLVVIRAHDCMTIFLGSRQRYKDFFFQNPGTYFLTSGWIERGLATDDQPPAVDIRSRGAYGMSWDELVETYGEDSAEYLVQQEQEETRHYNQLAYIEMGVEPDDRFESESRRRAEKRRWKFQSLRGDMNLLQSMLNGEWERDDILVVPRGHEIANTWDDAIIRAKPCE